MASFNPASTSQPYRANGDFHRAALSVRREWVTNTWRSTIGSGSATGGEGRHEVEGQTEPETDLGNPSHLWLTIHESVVISRR